MVATSTECPICQKTFSRIDHLHRHSATHSQHKPYACFRCGKRFARRDAARRHEANHATPTSERRACAPCATARVLCRGGHPCSNCEKAGGECTYLPRLKKRCVEREALSPGDSVASPPDLPRTPSSHAVVTVTADEATPRSFIATTELIVENEAAGAIWQTSASPSEHLSFANDTDIAMNWLPFDVSVNTDVSAIPWMSELYIGAHVDDNQVIAVDERTRDAPRAEPGESTCMASLIAGMGHVPSMDGDCTIAEASPDSSGPVDGERGLYAHGAGARISQAERSIHKRHMDRASGAASTVNGITFSETSSWTLAAMESAVNVSRGKGASFVYSMPETVYSDMLNRVDDDSSFKVPAIVNLLNGRRLPSREFMSYLVQLYFDKFHPIYPFLDQSLLNMPILGWPLCLATAAIGCRYANAADTEALSDLLAMILRGSLAKETQGESAAPSLPYLQAHLLNTMSLCQSSDSHLMTTGYEALPLIMDTCLKFGLFDEINRDVSTESNSGVQQAWMSWRYKETRRRTSVFAWILDCNLSSMRCGAPTLSTGTIRISLPSTEDLWEANSPSKWSQIRGCQADPYFNVTAFLDEERRRPTFQTAIATLFKKLQLVPQASQFARTALIYALVNRKWDMTRYFDNAFFTSEGQASPETVDSVPSTDDLANIPEFDRWRNGACDYLDVLHWDAMSHSLRGGGVERPIFLDLHVGRLLLLAPVRSLLTIMTSSIGHTAAVKLPYDLNLPMDSVRACQQSLLSWARRDRFKCRLAVVHAGATFWHVRRYSSDSIMQPFAVFLAALVLHYFSKTSLKDWVHGQTGDKDTGHRNVPNCSADALKPFEKHMMCCRLLHSRMPRFYNIDRPVDDEFVQYFVRNGESVMTLCAEAVDDLCTPHGSRQILVEAAAVLRASTVWQISHHYADVLEALMLVS